MCQLKINDDHGYKEIPYRIIFFFFNNILKKWTRGKKTQWMLKKRKDRNYLTNLYRICYFFLLQINISPENWWRLLISNHEKFLEKQK